ncbi:unnamed protein product [Rangifer tarandus platyrhynchus]|uniref:Uncharacterized protein n=2 Tax=Rangifer tarandus platyrhynchus TaxID=3082113 RepID=A0ACB0E7J7_RANTA|nr:unnamed protein product [Rangifer tarandus platyrhynchus]CAI9696288.1 unnamed protein product [Rangifer tarandus platyrhynchus]
MTPPRGHGPGAGRGGRDRSGQSGRAGSGWMRALFPTPASGPGHRRVWRRKLQRQRESAASPGRPGRNRRETGTAKSRRMGRTALPWDSFPGCQDGPIWFPVRSQIYLQAEKSTLVFLGNSFRCVPRSESAPSQARRPAGAAARDLLPKATARAASPLPESRECQNLGSRNRVLNRICGAKRARAPAGTHSLAAER